MYIQELTTRFRNAFNMLRCGYLGLTASYLSTTSSGIRAQSSSTEFPLCRGDVSILTDGVCHMQNNNAACNYDGGDCCKCTCLDGPDFKCGERGLGFYCLDPSAECVNATASPTPSPASGPSYPDCDGSLTFIGDGDCDTGNNNAQCGYDGGDCCECTCTPGESFFCENFDCVDPDAPCLSDGTTTEDVATESPTPSPTKPIVPGYPDCTSNAESVGDGYCDSASNIPECGYDAGDCCPCTCVPSEDWSCGVDDDFTDFDCKDPDSGCLPTPSPTLPDFPDCAGFVPHIRDGFCDASNNNVECGYDGGDCCECTCVPGTRYSCSVDDDYTVFDCQDPSAICPSTLSGFTGTTIDHGEANDTQDSDSSLNWGVLGMWATGTLVVGLIVAAVFYTIRPNRAKQPVGTECEPAELPCS